MADLTLVLDTGTNKVKATASGGGDGMLPPTSLVGVYSGTGNIVTPIFPDITFDSGALTAGVWKSVASVTSASGVLQLVGIRQNSITTQQIGIRITIDGTQVLSFTNPNAGNAGSGIIAIGWIPAINTALGSEQVSFNTSFDLEVISNVDRSAGSSVQYLLKYYLTS